MYRLWEPAVPPRALWIVLVAAVFSTLWWIVKHDGAVTPLEGYALAGLCTSLGSPISWTHHLTWIVPLLVVFAAKAWEVGRFKLALRTAATYVLFAVQLPWQFGEPTGRHWSRGLIGQALENSYVAFMIVILAVAALSVHRANSSARPLVRSAWGRSVDAGRTGPASLGATGTQAALT